MLRDRRLLINFEEDYQKFVKECEPIAYNLFNVKKQLDTLNNAKNFVKDKVSGFINEL
jgi:hypothetical protein